MEKWDELLTLYEHDLDITAAGYEMMGRMLDKENVRSRLQLAGLSEMYIYGGGYLGIQLYQCVKDMTNVLSVVDKSGGLLLDIPEIPVIGLDEFRDVYKQQKVIITPIKFYKQIYEELSTFVPEDKILFLGELLGGRL